MAAERHADDPLPSIEEVIRMVERMAPPDRLRVLEVATRLVHEDVVMRMMLPSHNTQTATSPAEDEAEWHAERARILANVPPESSAHRLLGAFRGTGPIPMTPDEERAVMEEILLEKYAQ